MEKFRIRSFLRGTTLCMFAFLFVTHGQNAPTVDKEAQAKAAADLKARIETTPELPFHGVHFAAQPSGPGWESSMVSWMALGRQRYRLRTPAGRDGGSRPGPRPEWQGPPLLGQGRLQESRRESASINVWTVDAQASTVIKYSPEGQKLMTIEVGEQPHRSNGFSGTTDIAFGPNGRLFIADGYGNARVLEYSPDGKRVKQWGTPVTARVNSNCRIRFRLTKRVSCMSPTVKTDVFRSFTLEGKYIGEIGHLGRTFSLKLAGNTLWAGIKQLNEPTGAAGWIVKFDRESGKMLGHLVVQEERGLHSVEQTASGEPVTVLGNQLLWFKKK